MFDRRSLLKRFGALGLSIPAAMAFEGHLTMPTEIQREIAMAREPGPQEVMFRRYDARGYIDSVEIASTREVLRSMADGSAWPGPPTVRIRIEAVVPDMATVRVLQDAVMEMRNDRQFIIDLPIIDTVHGPAMDTSGRWSGRARIG